MIRFDVREALIESGFTREFINTLNDGLIAELFLAWDVEDPDEQWERFDTFLYLNNIGYDVEYMFNEEV